MGNISVTITLTTVGVDVGPIDLLTDADNFTTIIENDIPVANFTNGYTCTVVPDTATKIRVQSDGKCINYKDLDIWGLPLPSPTPPPPSPSNTPSPTPPPPTPTPTMNPNSYTISFVPIIVEDTDSIKRTKSYVNITPALQSGDSFKLDYSNYAMVSATGDITSCGKGNARRRVDGSSLYIDHAEAEICSCSLPQCIDNNTNTGYVVIDSSNISTVYFEVIAMVHIGEENLGATGRSTMVTVSSVSGVGSYTIDTNNNQIEVNCPEIL